MKFSDVKIGAIFSDKSFIKPIHIIKTPLFLVTELIEYEPEYIKTNAVSLDGSYYFFKDECELELVTKCINCKYKNDNYCKKLGTDIRIRESNMYYEEINQDPETFSCSQFEMKVKIT